MRVLVGPCFTSPASPFFTLHCSPFRACLAHTCYTSSPAVTRLTVYRWLLIPVRKVLSRRTIHNNVGFLFLESRLLRIPLSDLDGSSFYKRGRFQGIFLTRWRVRSFISRESLARRSVRIFSGKHDFTRFRFSQDSSVISTRAWYHLLKCVLPYFWCNIVSLHRLCIYFRPHPYFLRTCSGFTHASLHTPARVYYARVCLFACVFLSCYVRAHLYFLQTLVCL